MLYGVSIGNKKKLIDCQALPDEFRKKDEKRGKKKKNVQPNWSQKSSRKHEEQKTEVELSSSMWAFDWPSNVAFLSEDMSFWIWIRDGVVASTTKSTPAASSRRRWGRKKKKRVDDIIVSTCDEEADTVKGRFWQNLKENLCRPDLYSVVVRWSSV